ncbi:MAG TPA: hypothetical protein VM011_02590 [Gammaproteobacteria bacterium]|nr:hypothetical protein [Gammaproteobacteria bacterium]
MKKIKVTIVATAAEDYPGCADILGACPEFEIVVRSGGLHETGIWSAISTADVLVFDEAALALEGVTGLRAIQYYHPLVKLLLVLENNNENKIMEALALGFSGIIERASLRSLLRRSIPALYSGDAWVSRQLVQSLRTRLLSLDDDRVPGMPARTGAMNQKLN